MKTNLSKWFSIRKGGKHGLGIKLKKQKQNSDLSNLELNRLNSEKYEHSKRIDPLTINYSDSGFKIIGGIK